MDIRGYFSPNGRQEKKKVSTREKRRAAIIIDDDDDFKPSTKSAVKYKEENSVRKRPGSRIQYESDSDEESAHPKTRKTTTSPVKEKKANIQKGKRPTEVSPVAAKREETSVAAFFGTAPIKRTRVTRKPKQTEEEEAVGELDNSPYVIPESPPLKQHPPLREEHEDQDFSATLAQLDQSNPSPIKKGPAKLAKKLSTKVVTEHSKKRGVTPPTMPETAHGTPPTSPAKRTPPLTAQPSSTSSGISNAKGPGERSKSKTPEKKASTTPGPAKSNRSNSSFIAYLNRGGPKAPGSKAIPTGAENCLDGLTFVLTGIGESLDREETADLLKKYGGRVTGSVSKKTSYLVVGDGAGESKLARAHQLGIKTVDEDELLELIRTRPAKLGSPQAATKKKAARLARSSAALLSPVAEVVGTPTIPVTKPTIPVAKPTIPVAKPTIPVITPTIPVTTPTSPIPTPTIGQSSESMLWVDKHRPRSTRQIVGQQGDRSNVKKLAAWLRDWHSHRAKSSGATKKPHGARFGQDDGSSFRAALLSGPPGVGKTTSATLVCKEQGFLYAEMNASDARNKQSLKQMVASKTTSLAVDVFVAGGAGYSAGKKHVLIMDEVDGMSGNEDRGGMQELIQLIKTTCVPIICICNDRQHPKIRSLANYCYDLRFQRPREEQIKGMILSIAYKEGFKISSQALHEIIAASNHDIRQVLHNLSVWTSTNKNLGYEEARDTAKTAKKEMKLGPFDVARMVFMPKEGERELTLSEKMELFFHDYSIGPLFVQENYLSVKPLAASDLKTALQLTSQTADAICLGDLVSKLIWSQSSWGLLPTQALFSSVIPGECMKGYLGRAEFPSLLGNYSRQGKNDRLLQELQQHTRLTASCSKLEFGLDYLPFLSSRLTQPMVEKGSEGVAEAVDVMVKYTLTREDWESIQDVAHFAGRPEASSGINSKVKAQFTRTYNKEALLLPYSMGNIVRKRKRAAVDEVNDGSDDLNSGSSSDDDITKDPMIKTKTQTKFLKTAGSSGNGRGRGRGKAPRK